MLWSTIINNWFNTTIFLINIIINNNNSDNNNNNVLQTKKINNNNKNNARQRKVAQEKLLLDSPLMAIIIWRIIIWLNACETFLFVNIYSDSLILKDSWHHMHYDYEQLSLLFIELMFATNSSRAKNDTSSY